MENKEEIHILMVAFSSQGHINPMLRLAKRLTSKSLHVTLATTELARQRILNSSSSSATTIAGIRLEFFSDGLPLDYDRKTNLDHFMDSLSTVGPTNLSTIIKSKGAKFSCIITNPFIPWAADVAAEHGIPCALLWIQPCALYSIYYRFYNNINPFPTQSDPDSTVDLPGFPLLKTEDLPTFVLPSNNFGSFPKLFDGLFKNIKKFNWVLANSFEKLEKDVIGSMSESQYPIIPIGPLVPSELLGEDRTADVGVEMWKSDDGCIDWLNEKEDSSVIYVSFGSIAVLSAEQMRGIATGLKNSCRPFLWVVKRPDYPVKDGEGQVPLGFEEETKGQGIVVAWSPQIKVLMHPAIGCFLSHCGWNSMLETVTAGVAVIAYLQWSDQPTNAKLVVDVWQVGVRVRPNHDGVVTSEEVERCIEEVMGGPNSVDFKKNAAELKVAAREAVADGGSSDRNILLFVEEIIKHLEQQCQKDERSQ